MMQVETLSSRCRRCETPLESGDLRCAICSLPTPEQHAARTEVAAEVLRCDECGAAVSYDVRVQAPRCAFCGSVMHLERPEDPLEEAEGYLPFRVDHRTAQEALRAWLATRGFFRPSDLASASTVESLRPLWWVGWIFDCEALVSWAADSNQGGHHADWAPWAGQSPLTMANVLVSASRGLTDAETRALAPRFDLSTVAPRPHAMAEQSGVTVGRHLPPSAGVGMPARSGATDVIEGATLERFDVQRSAARRILASAIEATAAAHAQRWIPGTRYRNLKTAVLLRRLTTRRLALPSHVLAYRYGGKLFRVVVHGQDASCIVGESPISIGKVLLVIALSLGAIALVIAILYALSLAR